MKTLQRALIIMTLSILTCQAWAKEMTISITGYGPKQFALSAEQEQRIGQLTEKMRQMQRDQPTYLWKIAVIGNTDKTGSNNDDLGMQRATQVRELFVNALPSALVTARSRGSQMDAREVLIQFDLIPGPHTASREAPAAFPGSLLAACVILLAATITGVVLALVRNRKVNTPAASSDSLPNTAPTPATTEIYPVNGYLFPVIVENGVRTLPFFNLHETDKPMTRKKPEDVVTALKSCTKPGSPFADQLAQLVRAGIVTQERSAAPPAVSH